MTIFDKLLPYGPGQNFPPAVLVTGPQRSGTRIAAKMVAADLGYTYHDETEVGIGNVHKAIRLFKRTGVVVHAPGLCDVSHLLWDVRLCPVKVVVVVVRRPLSEILASCKRISWNEHGERMRYWDRPEFHPYLTDDAHVAQWKYDVLDGYQRPVMQAMTRGSTLPSILTVDYHDLSAHPLWFPKEEREGWDWDRTAPGQGGRNA